MTRKKGWKALILNFLVPGLGYVYGGNPKKGIISYLILSGTFFCSRFLAGNNISFLVVTAFILGYFFFVLIDNYRAINKYQEYKPNKWDKWYFYLIAYGIHLVIGNAISPVVSVLIYPPSMEPALQVGDKVVFIEKRSIARNDIALFKYPHDFNAFYVKRCIGLPGESIEIRRGQVYINGDSLRDTPELKFRHIIISNGSAVNSRDFNNLGIYNPYAMANGDYMADLTLEQAKKLKGLDMIADVGISLAKAGEGDSLVFPHSRYFTWNVDYFGPVHIPKKGDRIELNPDNILIYASCIVFENESAEVTESGLVIDGDRIDHYQFKENYYFMLGDNRHNSLDSRYWGFLPEPLIIGKALGIVGSRTSARIGRMAI